MGEVTRAAASIVLDRAVEVGQVVAENIGGLGVDLVATRTYDPKGETTL